ncbi:MAG: hypothetical protein ABIO16_00830, partial [Nocardioides sp.]
QDASSSEANDRTMAQGHSPSASSEATVGQDASKFHVESAKERRSCPTHIGPFPNVPNPCEQMLHLQWIARHQARWEALGFRWHAGNPAPSGLKLLFSGDVQEARSYFADDPLIATIRSETQGF